MPGTVGAPARADLRSAHAPPPARAPEPGPPGPHTAPRPVVRPVGRVAPLGVILLVLLRLDLAGAIGLFHDEAYYREWSRHLALGYFDHPPLVAWLLAACGRLVGPSALGVHLPALLLGAATSLALHRLARDLFPRRPDLAWHAVLLYNAAPILGFATVFTTPDAPLALFWVLTTWQVWRAVRGDRAAWLLAGLSAGMGLLSEYTFVLLLPGLLLFLLRRAQRAWLRRPEPWVALGLALLLLAPVLLWEHAHGWSTLRHQLVDRLHGPLRPWRTVPRFLVAQLALSPLVWAACVAGLWASLRRARHGAEGHALLALAALPCLAAFALASLQTYVNPSWFAPAFLTLLVAAAAVLERVRRPALRFAPAALGALMGAAGLVQLATGLLPPLSREDPAIDVAGWEPVGARLRAERSRMPDPGTTFVFSPRFQLAALAAFHAGPEVEVVRLGGPRPDAYDAWVDPAALRGRDALFLGDDLEDPRTPEGYPFRRCEPAGTLPVAHRGRLLRTFSIWRCFGYSP